jgi:hypothetical protein
LEVLVRTKVLILFLAVFSSACTQYFQIEDAALLPEPGAEVRARLAAPQPLELGTVTIHDVNRIEGDVYRSEGDTLGLFSRRIWSAYGFSQYTDGAVFYFDRSQFERLEQRKLVPVKTGIAVGAVAVGVVASMYYLIGLGGGAEGDPSPGTEFSRVVGIPLNWIFR